MDYTKSSFGFKVKKAMRYLKIYGLRRTLIKIDSQYHMKRAYSDLPNPLINQHSKAHVGVIGCGKFAYGQIGFFINKKYGRVMRGCMDIDINKSISFFKKYGLQYYTTDANKIIEDEKIDIIYIASNHATHADYAIRALLNGKAVHIEKPHAVNMNQLITLVKTMKESNGKVRLGFNRPNSVLGKLINQHLNTQSEETMLNWFVAGHKIEQDHWYFDDKEGGRILGNLCHWTDLILQMIPHGRRFPISIHPVRSHKSDCDIAVSYIFADNSIGNITFSAKGHTFEGVRETLNAHKGNILIQLKDFKELRIDNVEKIIRKKLRYRDHGHKLSILNSYKMLNDDSLAESVNYVWNTGYLMLKTKEALENMETITIDAFPISFQEELNRSSILSE